jgi:tetratricopeptide (TPR) repeat protein
MNNDDEDPYKYIKDKLNERSDNLTEHETDVRSAQFLMSIGDFAKAAEYYEKAWSSLLPKKDNYVWERLVCRTGHAYAQLLDYLGRLDEAEAIYMEVMNIDPESQAVGDFAIFLHRRRRNFDLAERYYQQSLTAHPMQASIHLKYAGFLRHVRKELSAAEHHYRKAIETNPNFIDALGTYASYLHGMGHQKGLDDAEKLYERCVEIDPCHPNNCCNYGLLLSEERHNYKKAEKMYEIALGVDPMHANTLYNYGVMLDSHMGERGRAEECYRKAIEANPNHPFALYNLAVLIEDNYSILLKVDGDTEKLKISMRDDASKFYRRACEASPNDSTTLSDYGRFLLCYTESKEKGEKMLQRALQLDPLCATALYQLGVLFLDRQKFDRAETFLRKLRKEHPQHAQGMRILIKLLMDDRRLASLQKLSSISSSKNPTIPEEVVDEVLVLYEQIVSICSNKKEDCGDDILAYTTLSADHGNSQQKMRAIAYLEKVNGSGSISVSTSISASGKREVELSLPLLQRNNPNDSDDDEIKALLT